MPESNLKELINEVQNTPKNSPQFREQLEQAYQEFLVAYRTADLKDQESLFALTDLYTEVTNSSASFDCLDPLGKLCSLLSKVQQLERVEKFSNYQHSMEVARQSFIKVVNELNRYLSAHACTQSSMSAESKQILDLTNRLLRYVPKLPSLYSTEAYQTLFNQVLRWQIALICQYPADSENEALLKQRRRYFTQLKRLVTQSGKSIGNPIWRSQFASFYDEALSEMWEYCYKNLEQYEPPPEQLRQQFLEFCHRSPEQFDPDLFKPLRDSVHKSGYLWRDKHLESQWKKLCETNHRETLLERVKHWVNQLDPNQPTQRTQRRIVIWLSLITWGSKTEPLPLKEFTTWLGDILWGILQKLKLRYQGREELYPLGEDEDSYKNPISNLVDETRRGEAVQRWDQVLSWAEADPDGELRQVLFQKRKDVTAQVIIIRRLQTPPAKWKEIAEEFNLIPVEKKIPRLSAFFSRSCVPLIQQYCQRVGLL